MTQYLDSLHLLPNIHRHFDQIFILSMPLSMHWGTIACFAFPCCCEFIMDHLFLETVDLPYRSVHRQYTLKVTLLILRIHRCYLTSRLLDNVSCPSTVGERLHYFRFRCECNWWSHLAKTKIFDWFRRCTLSNYRSIHFHTHFVLIHRLLSTSQHEIHILIGFASLLTQILKLRLILRILDQFQTI